MSNLNLTEQGDRVIRQNNRNLSDRSLLLFFLASALIHSLSLFLFPMYQPSQPQNKDRASSKPIEFVTIVSEESSDKPPLETQKRSLENSVARQNIQPQKTAASQVVSDRPSSKLIAQPFPPIRILKPELDRPQPKPPIPIPKTSPPIPKLGSDRPRPKPPIPILKTTTVKKVDDLLSTEPKIKPVPSNPLPWIFRSNDLV